MSKEARVLALAALLGTASGSAACAAVAYYAFPAHVVLAAVLGAVVGAVAGLSGETIFEATIICLINGVVIWMLLYGFWSRKMPTDAHELIVMLISVVLLAMAIGMLVGSLARRP